MLMIVVYDVFQVARHPDAVTVVTGIVGCAGLKVRLRFSLSESFQNCCDTPAKISLCAAKANLKRSAERVKCDLCPVSVFFFSFGWGWGVGAGRLAIGGSSHGKREN